MTATKFGTQLRTIREGQGISLRRFAAAVGVTPTYISDIERNRRDPPTTTILLKMAGALGITFADLNTLVRP